MLDDLTQCKCLFFQNTTRHGSKRKHILANKKTHVGILQKQQQKQAHTYTRIHVGRTFASESPESIKCEFIVYIFFKMYCDNSAWSYMYRFAESNGGIKAVAKSSDTG